MKHWKNLGKRGLALFLVLMMCMTMLPTAAFAVEEETIPCEACEGRGMVESACPDCGGTGKVSVTSACPDCEEPAECPACNGTGEVTEEVTADCKACGGTGTVTDPETEEPAECGACNGTGEVTEEVTADCDACGGTGEAECPTCGGTRQVDTETDCANCGGTGEVERICAECGSSGRVAKSQEDPVDTEAIAAAVGGVAEELQDLGDRFGAFQEEFFWNLTGDEEDPMADFTAAAVVEFGEEFNALLAKYKAIPAEVTETEYAGTYAEMEYALQMMADAMGGDLNSGVETLAYDAPRTIYLYIDPNGGSVGRVVKTASVFDGKSFSSIVQTYFPSYYKPTNQYKQRSNSYGSWTSRSTSESTSYQDVLIANWHEHSYNWTSISDTQHQLVCSCGQTSGNPQSHNRSILSQSAATCDSYASTTYYCSTCGHTWTEYGSSYATHTWGNWYNNGNGKEQRDCNYGVHHEYRDITTQKVTVTYMDRGVECAKDTYDKGTAGVTIRSSANSRPGYTLLGWDTDSSADEVMWGKGDTLTIKNNMTLYAVWQKDPEVEKVTLTYDANGGTNAPTAVTVNKGENVTIKGKQSMTRNGYTFLGWSTDSKATTADRTWSSYGDVVPLNANTTLYAVWKPMEPNATFTLTKQFVGLDKIPDSFSIEYTVTLAGTNNEVQTKRTLTASNASVNASTLTLTWNNLPYYYLGTAGAYIDNTVTLIENADVTSYTNKATYDGGKKAYSEVDTGRPVMFLPIRSNTASGTVSHAVTNTYTAVPALKSITKTLTGVTVNGVDRGTTIPALTVGDVVVLTYKITVTGDAGAKYTVTDPGAKLNDTDADTVSGTIPAGATQVEITATKTVTVALSDTKISNTAYVKPTDSTTEPIPDDNDPKKTDPEKGYPSDPVENDVTVVPASQSITLTVTKNNSAENGHGFDAVDGKSNTSKVSYTVTVTNSNTFDVSGLDIIDALATTIQNGNTQSDDAKITLANVAFTLQNPGDEKAQPIENVVGPTSNIYTNNATPPDPGKGGEHTNKLTWNVLPKGTVFKSGAVVTLTYDILVENDSYDDLSVNLNNKVFAGTWKYTPPAPANRMMKAAARSGGYDGSGSASSGASNNVNGNVPGKCPIEVKKTADPDTAIPGATVTYTVTIKNLSSSTQNLLFKDVMASGLTMVGSLSITGGSLDDDMITIRANKTAIVIYQAKVGSDVTVGTQLTNTFTATVENSTKSASGTATVTVKEPGTYTVTYHYIDADGNDTKVSGGIVTDPATVKPAQTVTYPETDGKTYALDKVVKDDDAKTIDVFYGLDAYGPTGGDNPTKGGSDGIPDKYQAVVTYKVSGGTWNGTDKADKEYVFTLYEKDDTTGEWTKLTGDKVPKLADTVPTGMAPDAAHVSEGAAWKDSTPESTTPVTEDVTYTYSFSPKGAEVTYPEFKDEDGNGEPDKLPEEKTDGVAANVKIIVNPNGGEWNPANITIWSDETKQADGTYEYTTEPGDKITLLDNPTRDGYVFMGWEKDTSTPGTIIYTAKWLDDTKADPSQPDGNGDKPGDGIPDDWQYTVTYKAVGGTVSFESTVVTKLDDKGKPFANGTAKLAAEHIPTSGPDTSNGYAGTGSWSAFEPVVGKEITGNTEFTVTFQKTEGSITVTVKDTDGTDKGTWKEDPEKDKTLTPDDEGKVKLPDKGDITPPDGKVLDKWKDKDSDTTYEPGADITPDKNLTLEPVWKNIGSDEELNVKVDRVEDIYKGEGYPVTPTVTDSKGNPVGYTVTYTKEDGTVVPVPVDAGTYTATVKVGDKVVGTATVTIGRRPVTITSANASKTYDGTALTNHNVTVGGLGFVPGQGATYAFTGSQTTVNSSPNYFTYALTAGTLAANYNITVSYGTLTVSRRTGGGGGGGTGGGTTTINDGAVPLAGDLQLNKTDHFAYIKGYQDGTVRPNNPLTRAQVATIFYRLLDETSRIIYFQETNDFTDVADDFWACKAISTLTNAGIITGFQDGTFRPNAYITRAQFAAIAARFDNVVPGLENPFSDVSEDYWARDLIAYAASKGWIEGESGKFRPLENITRVEAMDFINNVLDRHVDEKGILAGATTFTDVPVTDPNYYVVEEATNSHDYTRRSEGQLMENWTKLNPDPVWEE